MNDRIIELEKKIAFLDVAVGELNATVTDQYKRIETLERELKHLQEKLTSGDLVKKQEHEEPPPHY